MRGMHFIHIWGSYNQQPILRLFDQVYCLTGQWRNQLLLFFCSMHMDYRTWVPVLRYTLLTIAWDIRISFKDGKSVVCLSDCNQVFADRLMNSTIALNGKAERAFFLGVDLKLTCRIGRRTIIWSTTYKIDDRLNRNYKCQSFPTFTIESTVLYCMHLYVIFLMLLKATILYMSSTSISWLLNFPICTVHPNVTARGQTPSEVGLEHP